LIVRVHRLTKGVERDLPDGRGTAVQDRLQQPQRWSWTTPLRAIECVEMVSLGNDAWSTTSTSRPRQASSMAVADPAARPPTTTTSRRLRFEIHGCSGEIVWW
jgi:hypothetical protein